MLNDGNSRVWELETGGSEVQGHPLFCCEFQFGGQPGPYETQFQFTTKPRQKQHMWALLMKSPLWKQALEELSVCGETVRTWTKKEAASQIQQVSREVRGRVTNKSEVNSGTAFNLASLRMP